MQTFRQEDMVHFAVVVDGEVATFTGFPKENEMNIAIYKSNPVFIEVPFDQKPGLGFQWDGTKFFAPGFE
jgi:hypothetical protein